MAQSTFGGFLIGLAVGVAATMYGPQLYSKYVKRDASVGTGVGQAQEAPPPVRVEVPSNHTPGVWRRKATLAIEYSQKRPDGKDWDWPMTSPELTVCIREGSEYRKCIDVKDPALKNCQGQFQCVTDNISVPDVPFTIELFEYDDYNPPDPIGAVDCDIGRTCEFPLGRIRVMQAKG